jgi:SCP-2 sterol transfer family protein
MEFFGQEWAAAAKDAINAFPDDTYRETKLFMYWDWIAAARKSFNGSWAVGVRDLGKYVTFTFADGVVQRADLSDEAPEATFVLAGDLATWKDVMDGYDAGKAVMYRRFRLDEGDVFRFFNRIYLFTESLVAMSKVPAEVPAA